MHRESSSGSPPIRGSRLEFREKPPPFKTLRGPGSDPHSRRARAPSPASLVATASPPLPPPSVRPDRPPCPARAARRPRMWTRGRENHDGDEASDSRGGGVRGEWDVVSRSSSRRAPPPPRPPRPRTAAPGRRPPARASSARRPPRRTRPRGRPRTSPAERRRRPPLPRRRHSCVPPARARRGNARARARVADPAESEPSRGEEDEEPFWLLATLRRARADAARRASNLLRALALAWSRPDAPAAEPARRRRKTTKPPASEIKKNTSRRRPPSFGDRGRGGGRNQHRHGGVAGLAVAVAIAGALARWAFGRSRDAGGPRERAPEASRGGVVRPL